VEPRGDEIVGEAEHLVGQESVGMSGLGAGIRPFLEPPGDLGAAGRQRFLEDRGGFGPARCGQPLGDDTPVDDVALAGNRAHPSACSRFSR
jgi:hypothetical protein